MTAAQRTVQITSTFLAGYPATFDLYQPGTIVGEPIPPGYRWAGRIIQLQAFTDSRAINGLSLSLLDQAGDEFSLISEARIARSTSPLNLLPLLGYENGLEIAGESVISATIQLPQNVTGNSFITIMGFAEEWGLPAVPELGGGGSGGSGGGSGDQLEHRITLAIAAPASDSNSALFI